MTPGKTCLLLALSLLSIGRTAKAGDAETRQVIGGDILYTASASAGTEADAVRAAEKRAAHLVAVECSVPPNDSKVYRQDVARFAGGYQAKVQVGTSFDECDHARNAKTAADKAALANPVLAGLLSERDANTSPKRASQGQSDFLADFLADFMALEGTTRTFSPAELAAHERALDRKADEREALRLALKQDL